jgi:hypothetical protein
VGSQLPELAATISDTKLKFIPLTLVSIVPDRLVVRLPGACSASAPLPVLVKGTKGLDPTRAVPAKAASIVPVTDSVLVGRSVYVLACAESALNASVVATNNFVLIFVLPC